MAGPGNNNLIAGNIDAGYYGRVSADNLIDGDSLASLIGLTVGSSQNSNVDWLKFSIDGKTIFSPMKSIRYNISWLDIDAVGAVFGDKVIKIDGSDYKIRLWKGGLIDPSMYSNTDRGAIGSEWNKLILPLSIHAPAGWASIQYTGITEDWGTDFTDLDLGATSSNGSSNIPGSYTHTQEIREDIPTYRIIRGGVDASSVLSLINDTRGTNTGWRPVLELLYSPPNLKTNINGQLKEYENGWVNINGELREIDKLWTRIDNVLREV